MSDNLQSKQLGTHLMIRAGVTHNGDLNRRPFTEITSELKDCASRVPQTIITITRSK